MNRNNIIQDKVNEHYQDALKLFPAKNIVGIFLQGSQNYQMDTPTSDVDTKLIVAPSFEDIAFNKKPCSTTHIRENDEHIDLKDIRLMFNIFRKQNINSIEILFTPYCIINPIYEPMWNRLIKFREAIAHYNMYIAIKTMHGMARDEYKSMEHYFPAREDVIKKYKYDPKRLSHLMRLDDFMSRYVEKTPYEECLIPKDKQHLIDVKNGLYNIDDARQIADDTMDDIDGIYNNVIANKDYFDIGDPFVDNLLNETQLSIMKVAIFT